VERSARGTLVDLADRVHEDFRPLKDVVSETIQPITVVRLDLLMQGLPFANGPPQVLTADCPRAAGAPGRKRASCAQKGSPRQVFCARILQCPHNFRKAYARLSSAHPGQKTLCK